MMPGMTADQFAEVFFGILDRRLAPLAARIAALENGRANGGDPVALDTLELHAILHGDNGHERHLAVAMQAMRATLRSNVTVFARSLQADGVPDAEILAAVAYMRGEHERFLTAARGELAAALLHDARQHAGILRLPS